MINQSDFGGDPIQDLFTAAVPLCSPGGSTIVGEGLSCPSKLKTHFFSVCFDDA